MALAREVRWQIVIGVAKALRAHHPYLLALQALTQGLQHADFVVDAVDAFDAVLVFLNDHLAPLVAHNARDGHFIQAEVPSRAAPIPLEDVQRLKRRLIGLVVAPKLQRIEQQRQHAPIVVAVRGAYDLVNHLAKLRSRRFEFLDQVLQGLQPHHGIEGILDGFVRMIDGRLRQPKEDRRLATDALQVRQQLLLDLLLSPAVDLVDDLHEQVDQTINDLVPSLVAKRRHQAMAYMRRMAAQIPNGFDGGTLPKLLPPLHRHRRQRGHRQDHVPH